MAGFFPDFLGHLLVAHLIFGETVSLTAAMILKDHRQPGSAVVPRAFRERDVNLLEVQEQSVQ